MNDEDQSQTLKYVPREDELKDPTFRESLADTVYKIYGGSWGNALGLADQLLKVINSRDVSREQQIALQARIDGILEGFKMSDEGYNHTYPFFIKGSTDEEILAEILPGDLKSKLKQVQEKSNV